MGDAAGEAPQLGESEACECKRLTSRKALRLHGSPYGFISYASLSA
jgi:hypothetical protein